MTKMKTALECVNARAFFRKYTRIKSYMHKMRGINGAGNPVRFTNEDKEQIKQGLLKMVNDSFKKINQV